MYTNCIRNFNLGTRKVCFCIYKNPCNSRAVVLSLNFQFRVEKSYKRFNEGDFFRKCETSFDKRTGYDRAPEQTFDYLNTMKNGSPKEIFQKKEWAERVNHERLEKMKAEWNRDLQEPHQEQESQQQGNSISQVPDINQVPQRKKQLEEELLPKREKKIDHGFFKW